MEKVSKG